jgi:pimeloyl-ACP methyl ester carboxylesterase
VIKQFVLIHGAWQGGWAWDGVASVLRDRGHQVLAPTLRGLEEGDVDRSGVTLADMAQGVIHEIESLGLDDFVLVGHSGGGPVAQYVADRLADRVSRIIFISAWVLRDGEAISDLVTPSAVEARRVQVAQSPDGTVPMDAALWASVYMQDATPGQLAAAVRRLVPTPVGWLDQPVDLPRFFSLDLPASFIFLRQDVAVSRDRYQKLAARLGTPRVVECDGGHEAMLTRPVAVAEALLTGAVA